MKKLLLLLPVVLVMACAGAADKGASDADAATAAVKDYLATSKGIELNNVDLTVADIKKEGDTLKCTATIALKEDKEQKFQYNYSLRQEGGKWKVASSESKGAPHMGKPAPPQGLPEGHPPVDSQGGQGPEAAPPVPEGHPPVEQQK